MDCPYCRNALQERVVGTQRFDGCPVCGGVWVETLRSLMLWAAFAEAHEPLPAIVGEPCPITACPRCRGPLDDVNYLGSSEVVLQRCNPCGRLWVAGYLQEGARRLWERHTGRAAQRMERREAMEEAFRTQVRTVGAGRYQRRVFSSDPEAQERWIELERRREREE